MPTVTKKDESPRTDLPLNVRSDDMEELVDYMAPLIMGKSDQTIFCQVNGENIRLQRGKMVKIKRKFKEVLDQSAQQEMAAYAFMEQAQRGSANALADLK